MATEVVHVVRQYYPSVGGLEDVVRNISAAQLKRADQAVRIVTLDRLFRGGSEQLPKHEVVHGVPVTRLPYSGSTRYPLCPRVLGALADADLVHVHGVDFFYDFLAVTRFIHRRPLVLSTHGGFYHTDFAKRLKDIWFHTITRASSLAYSKVIASSENDGRLFGRILPSSKLQVIENGVDTAKYADQGARELNRTLIYFGRWSSNKGLTEAMDLLRCLSAANDEWRLIIAGREFDYTCQELRSELESRGLSDKVILVPNPSDARLRGLIAEASYFICLSRHEGFGLAAIEAMSAGLTPVLSDIPPFRRLVENSKLGLLLDPAKPKQAAAWVQALHERSAANYSERRQQAMAFADRYSWQRTAGDYLEIYDQLVK